MDWMVLHIKPQQYARADDNVRNQATEFYAPYAMVRSERTRRLARRPLFPGYAFARPTGEQWVFLLGTRGVAGILMGTNEQPARLPHVEIERLRAREGPDGLVRLEAREFELGERVRVEKGAVSLDAIVDGMSGQDRVFVLVSVLGAQRRVEVGVADVLR